MNELIEKLKITINKNSQKKITYNENFITIKENSIGSKLKAVTINGFIPNDKTFAFSLDIGKNKICYYIDRKNFNKGCDGIIFLIRENKLYILLCELKSDNPQKKDYENQLKSSEAFVSYILKAVKIFDNIIIPNDFIKLIKILFYTKSLNKGITYSSNRTSKIKNDIHIFGCEEGHSATFFINQLI